MSDGPGISEKHPEYLAMKAAIFSEAGQAAAVAAAANGKPALAGVDQMLTETFVRYRDKQHYSIKNAGYLVAHLMRDHLGYTQGKRVSCPEGCTAQNGTMFHSPEAPVSSESD